jgi:hypothetical protein
MSHRPPVTRERAIEIARDLARRTIGDVDRFTIRVNDDRKHWKIDFVDPHATVRGDGQHFSVWVDKRTGDARMFRGR